MSNKTKGAEVIPTTTVQVHDGSSTDRFGEAVIITQEFAPIELCGIEGKNRYRVTASTKDPNDTDNQKPSIFYMNEESDCMERVCCSVNRSLTLHVHQGATKQDPVVLSLHKPFHLQGCICCCRPSLEISSQGRKLGRVEDPFLCETCMRCGLDQRLYDDQDNLIYSTYGSVCQLGFFCPCCFRIEFDIHNHAGGEDGKIYKVRTSSPRDSIDLLAHHTHVALITQVFNGLAELCCQQNKFKVVFPSDATEADKSLLIGSAMLLDLEYFERNKNQD